MFNRCAVKPIWSCLKITVVPWFGPSIWTISTISAASKLFLWPRPLPEHWVYAMINNQLLLVPTVNDLVHLLLRHPLLLLPDTTREWARNRRQWRRSLSLNRLHPDPHLHGKRVQPHQDRPVQLHQDRPDRVQQQLNQRQLNQRQQQEQQQPHDQQRRTHQSLQPLLHLCRLFPDLVSMALIIPWLVIARHLLVASMEFSSKVAALLDSCGTFKRHSVTGLRMSTAKTAVSNHFNCQFFVFRVSFTKLLNSIGNAIPTNSLPAKPTTLFVPQTTSSLFVVQTSTGRPFEVSTTSSGPCSEGQYSQSGPDCAVYQWCVNGKAVDQKCPSALHWNQNAKVCDWPANAKCPFSSGKWSRILKMTNRRITNCIQTGPTSAPTRPSSTTRPTTTPSGTSATKPPSQIITTSKPKPPVSISPPVTSQPSQPGYNSFKICFRTRHFL